ncbi:Hypothetical protein PHPALM_2750, partial [Phytophthora palmivora]
MVRVLKPFSAVIATTLSLGLSTADYSASGNPVSVLGDATYTIDGPICIGVGKAPTGTGCPLKVKEFLPISGGKCVAPKDAQCVIVADETWGCAYPDGEDKVSYQTPCPSVEQSSSYDAETPCPSVDKSSSGDVETPYQSASSTSYYGDAEVTYPVDESYPKEDEVTFPYEDKVGEYPDKSSTSYPVGGNNDQAYEATPCPTLPYNYYPGKEEYSAPVDTPCPTLPYSYDT